LGKDCDISSGIHLQTRQTAQLAAAVRESLIIDVLKFQIKGIFGIDRHPSGFTAPLLSLSKFPSEMIDLNNGDFLSCWFQAIS